MKDIKDAPEDDAKEDPKDAPEEDKPESESESEDDAKDKTATDKEEKPQCHLKLSMCPSRFFEVDLEECSCKCDKVCPEGEILNKRMCTCHDLGRYNRMMQERRARRMGKPPMRQRRPPMQMRRPPRDPRSQPRETRAQFEERVRKARMAKLRQMEMLREQLAQKQVLESQKDRPLRQL